MFGYSTELRSWTSYLTTLTIPEDPVSAVVLSQDKLLSFCHSTSKYILLGSLPCNGTGVQRTPE
jgi:hypothetical protein